LSVFLATTGLFDLLLVFVSFCLFEYFILIVVSLTESIAWKSRL